MKNILTISFVFIGLNCFAQNTSPFPDQQQGTYVARVLDSISLLSTIRPYHLGGIYVQGFHTPNDAGGGYFYWDDTATASAVPGMIIQVSGISTGRWKRKIEDGASIRFSYFGGKGDSSDETSLIATASAYSASKEGTCSIFQSVEYE